jgi:putative Mn2+ efflux pump MntP
LELYIEWDRWWLVLDVVVCCIMQWSQKYGLDIMDTWHKVSFPCMTISVYIWLSTFVTHLHNVGLSSFPIQLPAWTLHCLILIFLGLWKLHCQFANDSDAKEVVLS